MSPPTSIPANWSVAGVLGPDARRLPPRLTSEHGGITYEVAPFPATITPSPLAPRYTGAASLDVAQVFRQACHYIATRSARSRACNDYFRALGHGDTLTGLLGWRIVFFFWRPVSRTGAVPTGGGFQAVTGQVIATSRDTGYAEIAIAEFTLVGRLRLAATIVHELAHIAGAPGATDAQAASGRALRRSDPAAYRRLIAAEAALRPCLLAQMFDPDAIGAVQDLEEAGRRQPRAIA